jgi:hypothetical protein
MNSTIMMLHTASPNARHNLAAVFFVFGLGGFVLLSEPLVPSGE